LLRAASVFSNWFSKLASKSDNSLVETLLRPRFVEKSTYEKYKRKLIISKLDLKSDLRFSEESLVVLVNEPVGLGVRG